MANTSTPESPSPAAAPSPPPAKRGTRPKVDDANTLGDARRVLAAVKKHQKKFVAADAKRAVKRIGAKWIAAFEALLKQAAQARGGQRTRAVQVADATTQEIAARAKLYAAATLIRDEIATTYPAPGDDGIRRAFGLGARANTKLTGQVLDFADGIASAFSNAQWHAQAIAAGVTSKEVTALQALRDALAAFDTQQTTELNQRAAGTQSKNAAFKSLAKLTAYARKVAGVVLRGDASSLRDFARTTARRTPTPRTAAKKATSKPKKRARVAPQRTKSTKKSRK